LGAHQADTLNLKQIKLARVAQQFATSAIGLSERAKLRWLPDASVLPHILGVLHLCCEEMKLNTMSSENACNLAPIASTLKQSLTPVMSQIASWLGDPKWVEYYQLQDDNEQQVYVDQSEL